MNRFRSHYRSHLGGTAALAALLATSPVFAQSKDAETPAAEANGLSDIIVTAQRRQQSLQDVPIAVTAISGEELAAKQIRTTIDIPRLVPNMTGATNVGIGSANTYFIRGLGNTESISTFDPPVGTYVDDIYVSRQNANNFSFFDVDRIEVLRGPQGTLFGRNTTGGAINVVLKKPAETMGGYAEASYGAYNQLTGRASLDLPLSGTVFTKISAFGNRSDGYVDNLTTGEKNNGNRGYGVRAAVRVLPSDSVTWDVAADYIHDNGVNLPSVLIDGKLYSHTGLKSSAAPLKNLVKGRKSEFSLQNITKNVSFTSNLQIELGDANLALITGYRDLKQDYLADLFDGTLPTGGFAIVNAGHFKQFTQELKVTGDVGKTLQYTAGLFYIHESNQTDFADVFSGFGIPFVLSDRVLNNKTSAPAIYAQFDYKPTDQLTVTVGARYTSEKKTVGVVPNTNPLLFGIPYGSKEIGATGIPLNDRTKQLTPRISLEYRPGKDVMLFASATRGFRSGGWNARALSAENFLQFGPEKVWSYETGFRTELLDRTLRLNATAFYTDVNGFQVPLGFVGSSGAINFVTQNGSDFRNYGLEAEAVWAPVEHLSLFANLGLQKAKYLNPDSTILAQQASCKSGVAASCGQGIVDPAGNLAQPQRTPKLTLAFGGSYDAELGSLTLTPSANASYQSRNTVGSAAVPGDFVAGEWLVGAGLTLKPSVGPWKLSLECANCTNNHFVGSNFPPGFKFYNMPRTWRVSAGFTF
jgi:iron complex outermembrane receptor protein